MYSQKWAGKYIWIHAIRDDFFCYVSLDEYVMTTNKISGSTASANNLFHLHTQAKNGIIEWFCLYGGANRYRSDKFLVF